MKIASVADVKANLSAYIKASADELVVITKNANRWRCFCQWRRMTN
jgi:hypothetical protein